MMNVRSRAGRNGTRVKGGSATKGNTTQARTPGSAGPAVSPLGLGAMGMSGALRRQRPRRERPDGTRRAGGRVHAEDTADLYAMGHNGLLLAEALRGRDPDGCLLSVTFGMPRGPGSQFGGHDGRPEAVENFLAHSLTRSGDGPSR